jgi:hypothetical protein
MFHCNAEIVLGFFLWMDGIHENPEMLWMKGKRQQTTGWLGIMKGSGHGKSKFFCSFLNLVVFVCLPFVQKVQILLFFPKFGCFCLLAIYMFLMVCYYGSNATNLDLMMEQVPC